MDRIVERNLERLVGENEGDRQHNLTRNPVYAKESKIDGCFAYFTEFFYNPETGEMRFMDLNWNSAKELSGYRKGTLGFTFDPVGKEEMITGMVLGEASQSAKLVLEETVRIYNRRNGLSVAESIKRRKGEYLTMDQIVHTEAA